MGAQCEDSKKYNATLLKIVETFQNFLRGDWCQPTQELSYGSELVLHFFLAVLRSVKTQKNTRKKSTNVIENAFISLRFQNVQTF